MPMGYSDLATGAVTDVTETYKRVYLMAVDAIPDSTPLTAQLNRTKKFKAAADKLYFNVKLQTGGKVANVASGKLLPSASRPVRRQGSCGLAHTYTVVGMGGQEIPLTEDNRNAFVSLLQDQLDDGMQRTKFDLERQYNLDGRGILAIVETIVGAPTYDVYYPGGVTTPATAPGTMYFVEGMEVCFINPATGLERATRATVDTVNTSAEQITLSAAPVLGAIGDYVVLCNDIAATGSDMANNYTAESSGIYSATGSGDIFEAIDGGSFSRWNGSTIAAGGATITEKMIAKLEARISAKSGQKPNLHYTTRGISIQLQEQLAGLRRFTGETTTLKGGYEGLKIGSRTVLEGDWCLKGHWFALNTDPKNVGMVDLVAMGYVDLDGSKLHRLENRHAYRSDLWFPHQAIWFSRAAHGRITNLNDEMDILR